MKIPAAQDNRTAQTSPETKTLGKAGPVRSTGRTFAACSGDQFRRGSSVSTSTSH